MGTLQQRQAKPTTETREPYNIGNGNLQQRQGNTATETREPYNRDKGAL